jgi:hypothetical protein
MSNLSLSPSEQHRNHLIAQIVANPKWSEDLQRELLQMCSGERWCVYSIAEELIDKGVKPKYVINDLKIGRVSGRMWPVVAEAAKRARFWRKARRKFKKKEGSSAEKPLNTAHHWIEGEECRHPETVRCGANDAEALERYGVDVVARLGEVCA